MGNEEHNTNPVDIYFDVDDFMISSGELEKFNYVLLADSKENVNALQALGCTEGEIAAMRNDDDGFLDVYPAMKKRNYWYFPSRGVFKCNKVYESEVIEK